jgi:hypothetical protein
MGYRNPDVGQLIEAARSQGASGGQSAYQATVAKMIPLGYD